MVINIVSLNARGLRDIQKEEEYSSTVGKSVTYFAYRKHMLQKVTKTNGQLSGEVELIM